MATIDTRKFCGNLAQSYGWKEEAVLLFEDFLRGRNLYREAVLPGDLTRAVEEFQKTQAPPATGETQADDTS